MFAGSGYNRGMPGTLLAKPNLPALLALLLCANSAMAVEHIMLRMDDGIKKVTGQVLIEDSFGNLLFESDDGALKRIDAKKIDSRSSDEKPFEHLDKEQLAQRLLEELGTNFRVHESKHYVVAYNTTDKYAKWCSSLLERLQKAFIVFWKKKGCKVKEPEHPLAVLIFNDKRSYLRYAKAEIGGTAESAIGYYNMETNRIVMYDLTGMQALRRENTRRGTLRDITILLSQPEAVPLVATIVHEATHQIAFNCGLQKRLVDNPAWLGEGLAMYFETPDLASNRSWSGIGKVNYERWNLFLDNYHAGKLGTLKSLIVDDSRIRNPRMAVDAYAESWAWTYFLIKWHPKKYTAYLKMLREKQVLSSDDPITRLSDFQKHFGKNLGELEDDFFRRMSRIK